MIRPGYFIPALAVLACQPASPGDEGGSSEAGSSGGADDARHTYYRDVKAIVDARCGECHKPGTIAPFSLQTAEEVVALAPALRAAIELGTMPPWPPSRGCAAYVHDRSLTDAERDVVLAWIDDGAPVGEPDDAPPAGPEAEPIVWDAELPMVEAYRPPAAAVDDYRCFVLDWPIDAPKFVTGFEAVPDQPSIVHHVIAFVIPPDSVQTYRDLDAGEDGPGYTCFGGPGGGLSQRWLGGWAPGARPSRETDRGIRVEPGSAVVLQVHYHPTPDPPADRSKIRVLLADEVRHEQFVLPFTNPQWVGGAGMQIPAGEASVVHSFEVDLSPHLGQLFPGTPLASGAPFLLHTVGMHMHTRGVRGALTIDRQDGSSDCALDIPRWDFDWQGGYKLVEPIVVNPGDKLHLTCEWDNSGAGAQDIHWGEGTGDEMCLSVLTLSAL